jgi:polysaccharide chain length determinant protein (PEP-CTERM system associated)
MKTVPHDQALAYARQLWRYKWLSVGVAWAICVIGWPIVTMIPPRYESSTRVYVNADQLLTPLLHGVAVEVNPLRQVEFLQRTLLSRPNLQQVIHLSDLDLAGRTKLSDQEREELIRALTAEVVIRAQTPNLIGITYRHSDPVVAKNVVQALLTVFAENSTGGNRREMENAKRFLDQQIQAYETQLRSAEMRRAEFHQKYIDLLPGLDGAVSRLEAQRGSVIKIKLDITDLQAKRDSLQRELGTLPKVLSVDATGPQVIVTGGRQSSLRTRTDDARAKLDEMLLRFTERHPDVIAMRRQIAAMEAEAKSGRSPDGDSASGPGRKVEIVNPVYDQVKVRLVETETTLASADRRLREAERELEDLDSRAKATPGIQAQAQDLDRDYAAKKKTHEELLGRREQTRVGEAADTTADKIQFRVVDPPQIPLTPAAPNQPMLLTGVLVAALGGAVAVPLLLMQFDRSYGTVTNLRALGLPVLGSVSWLMFPHRRRRERIQIAALCASTAVLIVAYGVLISVSANLYRFKII